MGLRREPLSSALPLNVAHWSVSRILLSAYARLCRSAKATAVLETSASLSPVLVSPTRNRSVDQLVLSLLLKRWAGNMSGALTGWHLYALPPAKAQWPSTIFRSPLSEASLGRR
jgi:hypothetical protein